MTDAKDGSRARVLFISGVATIAALIVVAAWLGPGGCQSRGADETMADRLPRPRSPLEDAVDLRRPAGEPAAVVIVEPPEERPFPPSTEPVVRVRVAVLRGPPAELTASRGSFVVTEVDAAGAGSSSGAGHTGGGASERYASPLSISNDGTGWTIQDGAGSARRLRRIDHRRPIEVRIVDAGGRADVVDLSDSPPITFAGSRWPGVMRLHARSDPVGGIDVVVLVGLERYLPGVLAKELYRTWDLETYRAQAIAARSYAVCENAHWTRRRHFDMVAGEASQAWIGETDHSNAQRGAADTRGMLLIEDGRVVPAYYSSCCGGAAADAIDAVTRNPNQDIAALALGREPSGRRANCCNSAPTYAWTERVPADEVARRIAAWGRENGRSELAQFRGLASISVASVNEAGRTRTLFVVDGTGSRATIGAESLRAAINGAYEDPSRSTSGDAAKRRTLKSSNVQASIQGAVVVFEGRGHGHGVGLCQYGAEAMARGGQSWRDILARYYAGATPARCW